MAAPAAPRKAATRKKAPAKRRTKATTDPAETGLAEQMRTMAGRVLDMGAATVGAAKTLQTASEVADALRQGHPMEAAANVFKAILPGLSEPDVWAGTGAALRRMRKAAGLTITEVGAAINLKDP